MDARLPIVFTRRPETTKATWSRDVDARQDDGVSVAIYAGSFDLFHLGHLNVERAAQDLERAHLAASRLS